MDFSKFAEWGLPGAVIGALFFIVWRWAVWVMAWIKERDKQQAEERMIRDKQQMEERAAWLCRLEKINDVTNKISESIDNHDKRADERGRYVREEHKEMIDTLKKINGSQK